MKKAKQDLEIVWRELVSTLKLPSEWMKIDPQLLPIRLDNPIDQAKNICGYGRNPNTAPPVTSSLSMWKAKYEASQAQMNQAKSLLLPSLKLVGTYGGNAISYSRSDNYSSVSSFENPYWSIGLEFEWALSRKSEKADYREAFSSYIKSMAGYEMAKSSHEVDWINECQDVFRLNNAVASLKKAFSKQTQRLRLEEKRYRLGRSTLLQMIQAGDDATRSEIEFRNAQKQLRVASWKIKRTYGLVLDYFNKIDFSKQVKEL